MGRIGTPLPGTVSRLPGGCQPCHHRRRGSVFLRVRRPNRRSSARRLHRLVACAARELSCHTADAFGPGCVDCSVPQLPHHPYATGSAAPHGGRQFRHFPRTGVRECTSNPTCQGDCWSRLSRCRSSIVVASDARDSRLWRPVHRCILVPGRRLPDPASGSAAASPQQAERQRGLRRRGREPAQEPKSGSAGQKTSNTTSGGYP